MSMVPAMNRPLVSVIVPVRNGSHYLSALLRALDDQTLQRDQFEVIIADDGSTEPPVAFSTSDNHVRVLAGALTNAYAARNRGVEASSGKMLAFCDADCVPEPQWLEEGLTELASCDVVAGRIRFTVPTNRTVWTLMDMDTSKNQALLVRMGVAETANLFVRRDRFEIMGGFDTQINEHGDYDFVERCIEAGATLAYAEQAVVWHPTRQSASSVLRAHWVYSRAYAERRVLHGKKVDGLRLRTWIPVVSTARFRRRMGIALTPATTWLAENEVYPTRLERVLALPAMYLVLPYVRNIAQVVGATQGRLRRYRLEAGKAT